MSFLRDKETRYNQVEGCTNGPNNGSFQVQFGFNYKNMGKPKAAKPLGSLNPVNCSPFIESSGKKKPPKNLSIIVSFDFHLGATLNSVGKVSVSLH